MFFKSAAIIPSLLVLASAMSLERNFPADHDLSTLTMPHAQTSSLKGPSVSAKTDCEKEDEDDCAEFCSLLEQTSACSANGNKVMCFCKGGKGGASDCEERCLFCMPSKSALEEASRVFKIGGSSMSEL